ncbi:hypothetical protein BDQ17DRAFT_358037 [Cyathus striatus]|nr:hypothetical protein BDQ17DRAFT_358037 [Cyathus striatus]
MNQEPQRPSKDAGSQPQTSNGLSETLPEIPRSDLSVDFLDFSSPSSPKSVEEERIQKRASSVLKLSEENERLKAELKKMTDRLEAAERRRQQLARKEQLKEQKDAGVPSAST